MRKTVKVGITKSYERVAIMMEINQCKTPSKTTEGKTVDSCVYAYFYGSITKNTHNISYGDNRDTIKELLDNNDFVVLYHTKQYLYKLLEAWDLYSLNRYHRYCDHMKEGKNGEVCTVCGHVVGDMVVRLIPVDKLSLMLVTDVEERKKVAAETTEIACRSLAVM